MNLKRFVCVIAVSVIFSTISFGEIKSFTKEATETVPAHQSQDQVIAYVTQRLTREATEEAGIFIQSTLEVKNGKIEKDEIINIAGSISEVIIEEKEPFTKDKQNYVKVKVKIKVDTESVKAFLEKIKQDNKYKQEIEELRKAKLELEEKLKTATQQEYDLKLSVQAQKQVEQQKQRAIELNKMALKAKEDYAKAEQEQKQKELQRQEEFNALKKQMEQEQLAMQNKISQEKDEIRKAELENQAKLKELENKAKENMAGWDTTNKITIQQVLEEATKIKNETAETISKFETLLITNKEQLTKSYDTQIQILKSGNFLQENPVKDQWETTEQFKKRLQEYENKKQTFFETSQQRATDLEETKKEALFQDEKETLQSMITTTKPFIAKLEEFQAGSFYDKDRPKAEILSLGQVNADEKYFPIELKYNNKTYKIKFDFSDIGLEKAKLIYQTQNQLVIEPLFSVEETKEIFPVITGFNVKHLGTKTEKTIELSTELHEFAEISKFKIHEERQERLKNIETLKELNTKLTKTIKEFKTTANLKKFTAILQKLEEGEKIKISEKLENLEEFRNFIENLKELDNLIVSISACSDHTVGLKKDGTVVAVGDNANGQRDVQGWQDIIAISADNRHTVGLKKDGTVVAVGDNEKGQCDVSDWNDIVAISAGYEHTVGLKKDGTVVAVGGNENRSEFPQYVYYGQCDVQGWQDIIAISAGEQHTVGLKKDGTVVAVGDNNYGQCDVSDWNDIVAISAGYEHTVGLKKDGTVVAVGYDSHWQCAAVSNWQNIVAISADSSHTLGLKKDGTVFGNCNNYYLSSEIENFEYILALPETKDNYYLERMSGPVLGEFRYWNDIVAISAGNQHIVGLKQDGTVVAVLKLPIYGGYHGQCDVSNWSIKFPKLELYNTKNNK